jgi:hypothetical protein
MANPRGDGAVIAAATGIIDRDDGMDEPTNVRPTGAPTPVTKFDKTSSPFATKINGCSSHPLNAIQLLLVQVTQAHILRQQSINLITQLRVE